MGGANWVWAQGDVKFNDGVRYSQWVINSRIGDFYGNTNKMGFAVYDSELTTTESSKTWKGNSTPPYIDYVAGLVAKAVVENVEYYKAHDWSKPWYKSVEWYANKITVPTSGGSLDNLNASKLFFGIYNLANGSFSGLSGSSTTKTNATTALSNALTGLKAHNTSASFANATTVNGVDVAGGWFHKYPNYANQMWLDGQYMGPALLAQLINNKTASGVASDALYDWDLVTKQFTIVYNMCWNSTDKLLYHAFTADQNNATTHSDVWAGSADVWDNWTGDWTGWSGLTGSNYHSASYWGRANGWYFLGLVDVLEQMQIAGLTSSNNYKTLKGYLNNIAAGLAARQDASGCWYQILNKDDSYSASAYNGEAKTETHNYIESSATAIFTAAYLKGQRLGLFTSDYSAVARKAYEGLVAQFMKQGTDGTVGLYGCSRSAGLGYYSGSGDDIGAIGKQRFRDGSNAYYLLGYDVAPTTPSDYTEGKVMGAFIMAATEYERAYQSSKSILFSSDLKDSYTCDGTSDALTIEAAGANGATIDYQWYKAASILAAGSAVDGATSSSYIPTESGYYYCKATCSGTTVESRHASVLVAKVAEPTKKFALNVTATQTLPVNGKSSISELADYVNYTGANSVTINNGHNDIKNMISAENSVFHIDLKGSSGSYVEIVLTEPLTVGDVISFESKTDAVFILSGTSTKGSTTTTSKQYTIASEDGIAGSSSLYIWNSSQGKFSSMTITSPAQPVADKPVITQQPAAYTECYVGENVSLTAIATGKKANATYGNSRTERWWSCESDGTGQTSVSTNNQTYAFTANQAGTFYYVYSAYNEQGETKSQIATVVVKAKSNSTLPAPAGCNVSGAAITVPAFEMAEAGEAKVLNLNLPTGATATVTNDGGTGATINNGVLTYTAPASAANASIAIHVTAEDGTTTAGYTVAVSTKADTKLVTYAANDAAFGTVTAVYTYGGATFNSGDEVPTGTQLTFTATPKPGYKFDHQYSGQPWGNATTSKDNPLTFTIRGRKGFVARFVPLTAPVISSETIADAKYRKNATATALSVTATASEGGSLSYQWYKGTSNVASGGTPVDGATNASYTPLTTENGIAYYYCVVTETVAMKDDASKANGTATVASSVAKITTAAEDCALDHTGTVYGAIDQTTPYRQARTNVFELKEGEKKVFRFTNHGNSVQNWHNWNVAIVSSTDLNAASDDMIIRADNYGWGAIYNGISMKVNGNTISNSDWETFRSDMNNADVEVTLDYDYTTKQITVTAKSSNGKYVETATSNETSGTKGVYFFVDQSHFCNFRELLSIKATASDGCALSSVVVNDTPIAGLQNNETYFVEPNSKVVITTTPTSDKYLRVWNVVGTQGAASVSDGNDVYTINTLTANTTVIAKYGTKSSETLPRPANSEYSEEDGSPVITLTAFGSGAAGQPHTIALNLPEYATAVVNSGSTGSVDGDNLTITAPAQGERGSTIITVTAQNGSTKDYTIRYSTTAAPSYDFVVNAVKEGGDILMKITEGNASSITVTYPQYILSGTTLYNVPQAADSPGWYRKTFDITKAGTQTITYSGTAVNDVVFYTEGENIPGMVATVSNASRASNGAAGYNKNGQYYLATTIPAGAYTISARGVNGNNTSPRTATFKAGDTTVFNFSITNGNNNTLGTSQPFYVDKETEIYVTCDGSSASGLDWFYIKKADVLPVTVNEQKFAATQAVITSVKYATSTSASVSSETTKDGVKGKFYNLKNNNSVNNFVTVKFTGALGFKVNAYHGNGTDTRSLYVKVDNEEAKEMSVTPGTCITSPIYAVTTGAHTLKIYGANSDVYLADVIFLTEQPKGELTTKEVTKKVTEPISVETLASTSGGSITMNTNPSAVAEYATVSFVKANNELSITPVKAGTFTLNFSIAANGAYVAGTTDYVVTIRKEELTMTVTPDGYSWNKTTTKIQPVLTQPTIVLKDEAGNTVNGKTLTYVSDDPTVATVSGNVISLAAEPQGSANVYIRFDGDETYEAVSGIYSVLIEQGVSHKFYTNMFDSKGPDVGTEKTLYDVKEENGEWVEDKTKPLVYYTFGGWKYTGKDKNGNDVKHLYWIGSKQYLDAWGQPALYSGGNGKKPTYVDGYNYATSGAQDAMDESKIPSDAPIFGKKRNGWFKSESDDPHVKPFTLPCRGSYIKYEPMVNGTLSVYLLQNGAFNTETGDDGKSYTKVGDFQPHAFHVVDQNGTAVPLYTDFQFIVKEPVTQKLKNGTPIICSYEGDKVTNDLDNGFVPNGVTFLEYDVATWPMFYTNYSKKERQDIKNAWSSGIMGAQKVVKLHNGSFFLIQKAYVKYTFYVAAGQTYYIFSNFSKIGMSGINFVKDAEQPREDDVLALNDKEAFPTLKNASDNVSKNLTIPQYGKITVNRNFNANQWNTICLPFDMTEREVEENFGKGTQLLIYDGVEDGASNQNLHFVYHEIQSILAGYPYLIKTAKTVSGITVKNKLIQPKNTGTPSNPVLTYTQGKDLTTFSASRYYCGTPYVAEPNDAPYTFTGVDNYSNSTPMLYQNGSIYMSGTGLKRLNNPAGYSTMKGYRAYLKSNNVENNAKSLNVFFMDYGDEDLPTSIDEVISDDEGEGSNINIIPVKGIFTIGGQKIDGDLRSLPAGVYIVNGQKMYVK